MLWKSFFCFGLMALVLGGLCLVSGSGSGGQAAAFMRLPVGTRPAGMGYAFVSVSDDVSAVYFNPAGLGQIDRVTLGCDYSILSLDREHYQAGVIVGNERLGSVGLMVNRFGVSDIESRDANGNRTGTFSDSEMAIIAAYGKRMLPGISFGVACKYINHSLYDYKGTGFSFDLGLHGRLDRKESTIETLRVGFCMSDLGGRVSWNTDSSHEDEIPNTLKFGCSALLRFEFLRMLLAVDGWKTSNEETLWRWGSECWLSQVLALRIGMNDDRLSAGASLRWRLFRLDYAYSEAALGETDTNRIGLQLVL